MGKLLISMAMFNSYMMLYVSHYQRVHTYIYIYKQLNVYIYSYIYIHIYIYIHNIISSNQLSEWKIQTPSVPPPGHPRCVQGQTKAPAKRASSSKIKQRSTSSVTPNKHPTIRLSIYIYIYNYDILDIYIYSYTRILYTHMYIVCLYTSTNCILFSAGLVSIRVCIDRKKTKGLMFNI